MIISRKMRIWERWKTHYSTIWFHGHTVISERKLNSVETSLKVNISGHKSWKCTHTEHRNIIRRENEKNPALK